MENFNYNCHYCGKSYIPRRRYVQRFCCTSCRVNAFKRKIKPSPTAPVNGLSLPQKEENNEPRISLAGIGNAAIANVATDFAKHIFIKEDNKPATKGDLKALMNQTQQRYLPVHNAPLRNDGTAAFYDTTTKQVIYLKQSLKWK